MSIGRKDFVYRDINILIKVVVNLYEILHGVITLEIINLWFDLS